MKTKIKKTLLNLFYSVEHETPEEDSVKSYDLCSKCEYSYLNHNCGEQSCRDCENHKDCAGGCRCLIIEKGDLCPYFKRFEKKEGAENA